MLVNGDMDIKVVNRHTHTPTAHDVYIGRGSGLGNPFSSKPSAYDVTRVSTRESAIERYEDWLSTQLKDRSSDAFHAFRKALSALRAHGAVNLVCYCAPKPCHGDVVQRVLRGVSHRLLLNKR